jgi:hypothetical protein
MRECLDEGLIQSYADGELSLEMTEAVAMHIAACATCAAVVSEAEQETAMMAAAFAPEMSLSVPTVRLRERLDTAIAELQPTAPVATETEGSRLRAWLTSLFAPLSFAPRQAVSFASLLAVLAFALIFSTIWLRRSGPEYAREARTAQPFAVSIHEIKVQETSAPVENPKINEGGVVAVKVRTEKRGLRIQNKEGGFPIVPWNNGLTATNKPAPPKDTLLPGERSYLTAIASLTTTLEASGDAALKPSLRAEYERNLAVVDQAIEVTRRAAQSNPKDEDAATFLLAAYQSKVDLLNTVADQVRLSASGR